MSDKDLWAQRMADILVDIIGRVDDYEATFAHIRSKMTEKDMSSMTSEDIFKELERILSNDQTN